jgi:hypothetical protein
MASTWLSYQDHLEATVQAEVSVLSLFGQDKGLTAITRTRAVLSQVLSPTVMKRFRDNFAVAAAAKIDELLARKTIDAIADLIYGRHSRIRTRTYGGAGGAGPRGSPYPDL